MLESINDKISRYYEFNSKAIEIAMAMPDSHEYVHKKVLLFSIIDSLSKSISDLNDSNAMRFINTVKLYSGWQDAERVSLLHVKRALELFPSITFNNLESFVQNEMTTNYPNPKGLIRSESLICVDPLLESIRSEWPKIPDGKESPIGKFKIDQFTHASLFYQYRNAVVHEFRNPGNAHESMIQQHDEPYYQIVATLDLCSEPSVSHRWELIYPAMFLYKIASKMNKLICEEFAKCQSSPFAKYSDGSYWIPNLNLGY